MSRIDFINVSGCHLEKNSEVCSFQEILYDLFEEGVHCDGKCADTN